MDVTIRKARSGGSVIGSLLLASTLLLAACAPAAPPAAPTTAPAAKPAESKPADAAKPAAAKPADSKPADAAKPATAVAPTGVLKIALNGEPPTLDPSLANDLSSSPLSNNLYATLIATDPTGKLIPSLAASWTISPDGTTFTFKLQPNGKFHNGEPIEAKDVKWSWERTLNPATKSPTARDSLGDIVGGKDILDGKGTELTGARIVDAHTIEVKVALPMRGNLLTNLSGTGSSIMHRATVESGGERWFETKLVGSGPFKLKEWQHNTKVVLEAFPDYYLGSPKVAIIEMPIVTDPSTEIAQYENGELDVARVPLTDLARVRGDGKLSKELVEWDRAQITYLALNQKAWEPAKKLEVRQAIAHAIDRAKIVAQVRFGAGLPSANAVPPGFDGYDPNMKGLEFDPAKAKELLAKAGYPNGQGLPPMPLFANPIEPQTRPISEALAGMLKENLGIEAQVQTTEFARLTADLNKKDVIPSYYTGWSAGIVDPNYFLDRLFYGASFTNRVGFQDPAYDKLIDDANKIQPGDARKEAFRKANAYLAEQVPGVMIASTRFVLLRKPYVEGLTTTPLSWGMQPFVTVEVKR